MNICDHYEMLSTLQPPGIWHKRRVTLFLKLSRTFAVCVSGSRNALHVGPKKNECKPNRCHPSSIFYPVCQHL